MSLCGSSAAGAGRPRVLLISLYYAPEQTGIPVYNTGMCSWLAQHGWEVRAQVGTPHYPWWKVPSPYADRVWWRDGGRENRDGVDVHRVRHAVPSPPLTGLKRIRLDLAYLWRTTIALFAVRRRPHVVVAVAPPFLTGAVAWFHAWRWRVPVVYHVQDLQIDAAQELGMLPKSLCRILARLENLVLRRMDMVSTISSGMRRRIEEKRAARGTVADFPNWADTGSLRPLTGPSSYRADWGVADTDVVVAYSGNLGRKQGLDLLLDAFARLGDEPGLSFVIAGEGAERDDVASQAERLGVRNLRLLPLAPVERLGEFLNAADIFCIPQRRGAAETVMPSKLLNLMATARPVIATADPGTSLHAAFRDSGCGVTVAAEDPLALAAAIRDLVRSPALRARCGAAGRAYVVAQLDRERVLGRQEQRLRSLIHRSRQETRLGA